MFQRDWSACSMPAFADCTDWAAADCKHSVSAADCTCCRSAAWAVFDDMGCPAGLGYRPAATADSKAAAGPAPSWCHQDSAADQVRRSDSEDHCRAAVQVLRCCQDCYCPAAALVRRCCRDCYCPLAGRVLPYRRDRPPPVRLARSGRWRSVHWPRPGRPACPSPGQDRCQHPACCQIGSLLTPPDCFAPRSGLPRNSSRERSRLDPYLSRRLGHCLNRHWSLAAAMRRTNCRRKARRKSRARLAPR